MHILTIIILALVFLPGLWVRFTLSRYSKNLGHIPGTGAELVSHLIKKHNLNASLEQTDAGDHYDPETKTIRLSLENLEGRSLTAVATAAHEFGHALQDAEQNGMMTLRTHLAKHSARLTALASGLLILVPVITAITRSPALGLFLIASVVLMTLVNTGFHLATLPLEWDASFGKALPLLEQGDYLGRDDLQIVRKILAACALTYAAQSVLSVLNMRNLFAVIRR